MTPFAKVDTAALDGAGLGEAYHPSAGRSLQVARDLLHLTKPRITLMVIVTGLGGMWLAARTGAAAAPTWGQALFALTGISAVVGSANALNMLLERDSDALMERTKNRPLPTGRLSPAAALAVGVGLAVVSLPLLALYVNALTAALSALALALYVGAYTPLKRVSPIALLVGAVPGAMPPLLGWTAVTGEIGAGGLALFSVLFFWQLPHFLAIATFRREEYERASIKVMPAVRSQRTTRIHAVFHTVMLVVSSLALVPLGVTGPVYLVNAVVLGGLFLWATLRGFGADAQGRDGGIRWARSVFAISLLYLPMLIVALMVSA